MFFFNKKAGKDYKEQVYIEFLGAEDVLWRFWKQIYYKHIAAAKGEASFCGAGTRRPLFLLSRSLIDTK